MVVLVVPILLKVGLGIGLDPVHLGVIIVLNLMVGMATPPFGMSLYTVAKVEDISPIKVMKELTPQYIPLIIALLVVTFWPELSLWLPNLLFE
jgi:TRAP-type C4-dicarboxylate transport system permease large subunit